MNIFNPDSLPPRFLIPGVTGPCEHLRGRRVLVIVDHFSLVVDADRQGLYFRIEALAEVLDAVGATFFLHVLDRVAEEDRAEFNECRQRSPWRQHLVPLDRFAVDHLDDVLLRSDTFVSAMAVGLATILLPDVIVIGSGKPEAALACVAALPLLETSATVSTLSLPGTEAHLTQRENGLAPHVELGMDCHSPKPGRLREALLPRIVSDIL